MNTSQLFRVAMLVLVMGWGGLAKGQDASSEWTHADTSLANHYLKLLQTEPKDGRVLGLLWELYEKKGQTPLLLEYLEKASADRALVPSLIYAHLLRRGGETDRAHAIYLELLKDAPSNPHALRAAAEGSDLKGELNAALQFYHRLAEQIPADDPDGVAFRLRMAQLSRETEQSEAALALWEGLLAAHPNDESLQSQIVNQLLEAGEVEAAIRVLSSRVEQGDAHEKVAALKELANLYELMSDFDGAVSAARSGLELLHFKSHQYEGLFAHMVQLYEQFERLSELETALLGVLKSAPSTERALFDLAEFYRLTTSYDEEEKRIAELVDLRPSDLDYRMRLTRIQMENDRYAEAASTLDEALADQSALPMHLVMLRAKIALNAGEEAEAEALLRRMIETETLTESDRDELLQFSSESYLDSLTEWLLRESLRRAQEREGVAAVPVDLVKFLHRRNQKEKAYAVIEEFLEKEGIDRVKRSTQHYQIALVLRELGERARSLEQIDQAIVLDPGPIKYGVMRGELLAASDRAEEALAQLDSMWQEADSYEERIELDQHLYRILRRVAGEHGVKRESASTQHQAPITDLAQYRRLAVAAAQQAADDQPELVPTEVRAFYLSLKNRYLDDERLEYRFRVAWWAIKVMDLEGVYEELSEAASGADAPITEVESILLKLSELTYRPEQMLKHVTALIELDPQKAETHRRRRAELLFDFGSEERAVDELKLLAADPDAPMGVRTSLANLLQKRGDVAGAVALWESAFRDANSVEKRQIVKQLAAALVANGQAIEALQIQLALIEKESDPEQRSKQFDDQLAMASAHYQLDWLLEQYQSMAQRHPFDSFFPESLAKIHRINGNEEAEFASMKRAYYLSDQDDSLLEQLSSLAQRRGDLKSAIYYRRQWLGQKDESSLSDWNSFIEMLESNLDVEEADRLRTRLEARFGRDPSFLGALSQLYLSDGGVRSAARVLDQSVELKSWDLSGQFQLGQLWLELGEWDRAAEVFDGILNATEGTTYSRRTNFAGMPLVRAEALSHKERSSPGEELFAWVNTVEAYLEDEGRSERDGTTFKSEIASGLQSGYAEFRYEPSDPEVIRLRALEEAAALAARREQSDEWLKERLDPALPLVERLWAARYAENREAFSRLLNELPNPESDEGNFLRACGYLLAGNREQLFEWMNQAVDPIEGRLSDRKWYVRLACLVWLKNAGDDPLYDSGFLMSLIDDLDLSDGLAIHYFVELRTANRLESAYQVGKILADGTLQNEGGFLYAVSQVAGWLGREEDRTRLLDRSIETVRIKGISKEDLLSALSVRLGMLDDDEARADYLERLRSEWGIQQTGARSKDIQWELIFSLSESHYDQSVDLLGDWISGIYSKIRPSYLDDQIVLGNQERAWGQLDEVLDFYTRRISFSEARRDRLSVKLGSRREWETLSDLAYKQAVNYEIARSLIGFESAPYQERLMQVRMLSRLYPDRNDRHQLVRRLSERGFAREQIPIFLGVTQSDDEDIAVVAIRDLFEVATEALEPGVALTLIEQIESGSVLGAGRLSAEFLAEQKAVFLSMAREVDALSSYLGQDEQGDADAFSHGRINQAYRDGLMSAYRYMGESESLWEMLCKMREAGEIAASQRLMAAGMLESKGEYEEALMWLTAETRAASSIADAQRSILHAVRLHEKLERRYPKQLIALARESLEHYRPEVTRQVVESVRNAGKFDEAIAVLKLLRRKSSDPVDRFLATVDMIQTRVERGDSLSSLQPEWEAFFQNFTYRVRRSRDEGGFHSPASELIEWMREQERALNGVANWGAGIPDGLRHHWLAKCMVAHGRGELKEVATTILEESDDEQWREELLETLPAFGEPGVAAAREWVDRTKRPGTSFFSSEPVRQIEFFHRIGDRRRLLEVHTKLMGEAWSDLFWQIDYSLHDVDEDIHRRVPQAFEAIGEADLAGRLYRRYHETISDYRSKHSQFLEGYLQYLIGESQFEEAEKLMKRILQKTLPIDLRLLMTLYEKWGKLDEWEARLTDVNLSTGRRILLSEWRNALAEGREMVEYVPSW